MDPNNRMLLLVAFTCLFDCHSIAADDISIAVLSDNYNDDQQVALRFATYLANNVTLANSLNKLKIIQNSKPVRSQFEAYRTACSMVSTGISAMLSLLNPSSSVALSVISKELRIPLFAPTDLDPMQEWQPLLQPRKIWMKETFWRNAFLFWQLPAARQQSSALVDLIKYYQWKRMAILASDDERRLQDIFQLEVIASNRNWTIYTTPRFNSSIVDVRDSLKAIKGTGIRIIVLLCSVEDAVKVLQQAYKMGMAGTGWQWIVTNSVTETDVVPRYANSTEDLHGLLGTSLHFPDTPFLTDVLSDWQRLTTRETITPMQAVIIDSVLAIAYAIDVSPVDTWLGESLDCRNMTVPWSRGENAHQSLLNVSRDGILGQIQFNLKQNKERAFDVMSLTSSGWKKVGLWTKVNNVSGYLNMSISGAKPQLMGSAQAVADFVSNITSKTIRVSFKLISGFINAKPGFGMEQMRNTSEVPIDWVEGFCIDLLLELQQLIGFNFTLQVSPDATVGGKNAFTGMWTGIVGELVAMRADLGLTGITINRERQEVIDFTVPFMDLGQAFVMRVNEVTSPFRFFSPLSVNLWLIIVATMFVVSLIVTYMNKLSPYDYHGAFIQHDHRPIKTWVAYKKYLQMKKRSLDEMNFLNCFWVSLSTLLQQGPETYPRSSSARVTVLAWFFLSLLVTSTYTANLAALLTQSRLKGQITVLKDLASSHVIEYGVTQYSATEAFYEKSNVQVIIDLLPKLERVNSTDEGIRRAREGSFAYIGDSTVIRYEAQKKPCNMKVIPTIYGKQGYGIALQKNSPFRDELSHHITQLRERGFMEELSRKWLIIEGGCPIPETYDSSSQSAIELGVDDVAGVFYIMYAGVILSPLLLLLEWMVAICADLHNTTNHLYQPKRFSDAFRWRRTQLWREIIRDHCLWCSKNGGVSAKEKAHARSTVITVRKLSATDPPLAFLLNYSNPTVEMSSWVTAPHPKDLQPTPPSIRRRAVGLDYNSNDQGQLTLTDT